MKFSKLYYYQNSRWFLYLLVSLLSLCLVALLAPKFRFSTPQFKVGQTLPNDIIADNEVVLTDQASYNANIQKLKIDSGVYFISNSQVPKKIEAFLYSAFNNYFDKRSKLDLAENKSIQENRNLILNLQSKLKAKNPESSEIKNFIDAKNTDDKIESLEAILNDEKLKEEFFTLSEKSAEELKPVYDLVSQTTRLKIEYIADLKSELGLPSSFSANLLEEAVDTPNFLKSIKAAMVFIYQETSVDKESLAGYPAASKAYLKDKGDIKDIGVLSAIDTKSERIAKLATFLNITPAFSSLLQNIIQPSLIFDKSYTDQQIAYASEKQSPQQITIDTGTVLARKGEIVTIDKKTQLDLFYATNSNKNKLPRLLAIFLVVLLGIAILISIIRNKHKDSEYARYRHKWVLHSVFIITIQIIAVKSTLKIAYAYLGIDSVFLQQSQIYLMPLSLAGILSTILINKGISPAVSMVAPFFSCFLFAYETNNFIFALSSSLVTVILINRSRIITRGSLLFLGVKLCIINSLLVLCLFFLALPSGAVHLPWAEIALACVYSMFGAVLSIVLTMALLPLLELFFDTKTDIKLLELSTVNHPVLRELMEKAAGSYYHSIAVGSLAEAGALKIGANSLFCRIASYYHDIGKIYHPEFFIENMPSSGQNPHITIDDPIYSKDIIIGHVTHGVELANKYNLGQQFIDIIEEHHGTSLVRYFYYQAQLKVKQGLLQESEVKEELFRYAGPKPQNSNSALIMLADVCEASVRSLKNPTPAKIAEVVKSVSNHILEDGQLDDAKISLQDFKAIQNTYIEILSAQHHSRIEYPKLVNDKAS